MSDSPRDQGGPDPSKDANSYWQNLLGFPIDPWLGISDSALRSDQILESVSDASRLFTAV
jgi:hypothetical protein